MFAELAELKKNKIAEYHSMSQWYAARRWKLEEDLKRLDERYNEMLEDLEDKYAKELNALEMKNREETIQNIVPFASVESKEEEYTFPSAPVLKRQNAVRPEEENNRDFPSVPVLTRQNAVRPEEVGDIFDNLGIM